MINLLPPRLKQELAYAKLNARLAGYLWLVAVVILALSGTFTAAHLYLSRQIRAAESALNQKNHTIAGFRNLESRAKTLKDQLDTIATIDAGQTRFSLLLADMARATPRGAAITNLALTGDDKKPLRVSAAADSFNAAISLREALAAAPRISGADIENLTANPEGGYKVEITVGFKPGQAK
ncbi:hypothetical protein KY386_01940 [Candidatus Parcubacteria bacterium]|nr:hypothetical protein [Candidatus Parcubacteria bacterium]